jgi:hypothetical protein
MLRHNSSFVMVSHGGVHGRCYVLNTRVSVHDLRLGEGLVMCDISNKIATRKHENVLKLAKRGCGIVTQKRNAAKAGTICTPNA